MNPLAHGVPNQRARCRLRIQESCLQLRIISPFPNVCCKNIIMYVKIWTNLEAWPRIFPSAYFHIPIYNPFLFYDRFCSLFKTCSSEISFQFTLFISITTWFCNFVAFYIVPNVWVLTLEKLNLNPTWGPVVFGKFCLSVSCHIYKMREILPTSLL